jgi:hypothetical protein
MSCSRKALTCHPETPCRHVRAIATAVHREQDGALMITFSLDGDVDRLRIAPPGPPWRADGLWEHTCFEAFIALHGTPAYCELNFAPSGEWAAYVFRRYRDGTALELDQPPAISVWRGANRFELDAVVRLDGLPRILPDAPLRLGLSAVVEDEQGGHSYWALRHPPGRPDFHHVDAFALELEPAAADFMNDPAAEAGQ